MTIEESYMIVKVLKAVYNTAFSKYTVDDFDNLAAVWATMLEEYPYNIVSAGLKAFVKTNPTQFPPVPAQIIEIIHKNNPNEQQLNANEAWALVYKAICNSGYYAEQEFAKLPPVVQRAVGSADNLRAWAKDPDFNMGVEQSHFAKVYDVTLKRETERAKLPENITRAFALQTTERKMIEG